jgi:hypothetical protein
MIHVVYNVVTNEMEYESRTKIDEDGREKEKKQDYYRQNRDHLLLISHHFPTSCLERIMPIKIH